MSGYVNNAQIKAQAMAAKFIKAVFKPVKKKKCRQ